MKKVMDKKKEKIILYILLIISIFSSYSGITKSIYDSQHGRRNFFSLGLFTRENTLLVNLSLLLCLIKKIKYSKYLNYLKFNCFVNCLIIFFVICLKNIFEYDPEHMLLPISFVFYYSFIDYSLVPSDKFYIGFIYFFSYSFFSLVLTLCNKDFFPYIDNFKELKSDYSYFFAIVFLFTFSILFWVIFIYLLNLKEKRFNKNGILKIQI
ncbi:MAG: hypothetical protein Q8885_00215 [Candidatus Phytoplasma stylosanthis]|nr:hypothetical protein [Candidatus Phytoplasma stylosanthis]